MDGDAQADERARRAARREANAAAVADGGAGATVMAANPDVDLPGAAFGADVNDGASLPDAGSEFDELDREPDPTGVVDEALLRTPAPPPPPTPARLLPPPPRTTPRLLPPVRRPYYVCYHSALNMWGRQFPFAPCSPATSAEAAAPTHPPIPS